MASVTIACALIPLFAGISTGKSFVYSTVSIVLVSVVHVCVVDNDNDIDPLANAGTPKFFVKVNATVNPAS